MIEYSIHSDDLGKAWDDFVHQHEHRNPFQTRQLYQMYVHTKEFTPYFCIAKNTQNNKILGGFLFVIQKKKMPLLGDFFARALVVGGPLIPKGGHFMLHELLRTYAKFVRKKVIYSEIRNLYQWKQFYDVFLKQGFSYHPHLNYQVDVQEEGVEARFSSSKRRQIRKAQKNGVEIIENPSLEQIKAFYVILKALYATKINKPLPSWSFFESFYTYFVKTGKGKYLLVSCQNRIIGGLMMPLYHGRFAYEWYVAGEDYAFKQQYPSVMATWAGIQYAKVHGFVGFDFMGAGNPNQAYGVREFKSRFGGKLLNNGRFYKQHKPLVYFFLKLYLKIKDKKKINI